MKDGRLPTIEYHCAGTTPVAVGSEGRTVLYWTVLGLGAIALTFLYLLYKARYPIPRPPAQAPPLLDSELRLAVGLIMAVLAFGLLMMVIFGCLTLAGKISRRP